MKKEKFYGRAVITEPKEGRMVTIFDENLQLLRELHDADGVPQDPEATEHELRVFVNTIAPKGVRVQRNEQFGFVFDFMQ